jgi:chromosome segregation ATPase
VAGGLALYQGKQNGSLEQRLAAAQQETTELRADLNKSDAELKTAMQTMDEEFKAMQGQTQVNLANAQSSATRHADLVASKITRKAAEEAQKMSDELGKVKTTTEEAANKLDGISTQVGSVRTDVDSAKSDIKTAKTDIDQTKSDLQRARGDLGEMSGLIATNSKQIQTLRELGDRNIYEFTLAKGAEMQRVGDIQVTLKKTDARRNRFTVDVLADDKRVEKKDRTINEPVQFYTSKARQPYELVINQVQKDKVTGYLATPKVTAARATP